MDLTRICACFRLGSNGLCLMIANCTSRKKKSTLRYADFGERFLSLFCIGLGVSSSNIISLMPVHVWLAQGRGSEYDNACVSLQGYIRHLEHKGGALIPVYASQIVQSPVTWTLTDARRVQLMRGETKMNQHGTCTHF